MSGARDIVSDTVRAIRADPTLRIIESNLINVRGADLTSEYTEQMAALRLAGFECELTKENLDLPQFVPFEGGPKYGPMRDVKWCLTIRVSNEKAAEILAGGAE